MKELTNYELKERAGYLLGTYQELAFDNYNKARKYGERYDNIMHILTYVRELSKY